MKPHLYPLLVVCVLFCSCYTFDPVEPTYTPAEIELEEETCHLSGQVIVAFEEAFHGGSSYFFFVLLDESGNQVANVYTSSMPGGAVEVGEEISITFHYPANDSPPLYNGPPENDQPGNTQIKVEIIVCDWDG